MTWWHDDMMTWWHDDMKTCEIFAPLQAHVPPLKFVIFGRIAPLTFSEKHDDMMTWCLPPPQRVRRAHPIFRNFSKVPETFSTANTTSTRALQGRYKGLQGADIKSLEGRHWERCDKCSFYFTKSDQWSILVKENEHTRRYNPFYFTKSDEKCVLVK